MYAFKIKGGQQLSGTVEIKGAKNALLPLMICTLLTKEPIILHNCSLLADVKTLMQLLESLGTKITLEGDTMTLQTQRITNTTASYDFISKMRAGFWVLGPLLARMGEAKVSLPGGCAIGARALDIYFSALTEMGADIKTENGYIMAYGKLHGADITCWRVTVGGTHNTIMAAALTPGKTIIHNVALEPEVMDLIALLTQMGIKFEGVGTRTLTVHGAESLKGAEFNAVPDRIETMTFIAAAVTTKSKIFLKNARTDLLKAEIDLLSPSNVIIEQKNDGVSVDATKAHLKATSIITGPYPEFATDNQSLFCAMLATAEGESLINEKMHDNRLMHVPELNRMGANIRAIDNTHALIAGVKELSGTTVMASDLRGGAALVVAALGAKGDTLLQRVYHIDRGYRRIEEKLQGLGADIERIWLD
ncbi:MAG: UDP-N-acetylglucosamine 1-carboxyvinyltransferase [Alphaproteobacteria bacterium]|nr:UDP-N-acetylglucosamine 1-carboxyvinyltransferase [Alphaproteobacteria bacterium]